MFRLVKGWGLVVAGLMLSQAQGATYYVSKSGYDGRTCDQAKNLSTARQTINAGLQCLQSGDTLVIDDGLYEEFINNSVPGADNWATATIIKARNRGKVTLKPKEAAAIMFGRTSTRYIIIDGLRLQGAGRNGFGGSGLHVSHGARSIRFQYGAILDFRGSNGVSCFAPTNPDQPEYPVNCEILHSEIGNNGHPTERPGTHNLYLTGSGHRVEHNEVYGGGCWGIRTSNGRVTAGQKEIVSYNRVHGHARDCGGIILYNNIAGGEGLVFNNLVYDEPGDWAGIRFNNNGGYQVINNTVVNSFRGFYVNPAARNITFRNNIAVGNIFMDYHIEGSNCIFDYNLSSGKVRVVEGQGNQVGSRNLVGNPQFVDPGLLNFKLKAGSPAIDKGITASFVSDDLAGTSRPQGAAHDLGAYEWLGSLPPPPPSPPKNLRVVQ